MEQSRGDTSLPKAVLIDLSGTLHVSQQPLPGAVHAIERLRRAGLKLLFASNTSSRNRRQLHQCLRRQGFDIAEEELFTAPRVVRRYLQIHSLRPHLLVHPDLVEEFAGLPQQDPDTVVVGFAPALFNYDSLNHAFRLLKKGARLIATGRTACFEGADGLLLDAGPFVTALEYAAGTRALVLGKPSPGFFHAALEEVGCRAEEAVMIGDDAESDVGGALAAGLGSILVQTGKYRRGDEHKIGRPGALVVADIGAAAAHILEG
jgi:HAD superfamily hydrolase (TIGR01458 family)